MLIFIFLVKPGDGWFKWIIGIGIIHHRADAQQNLGYSQSRTPVILQNIQTDCACLTDVAVIYLGYEGDNWRLERISRREANAKIEDTTFVWAIRWTHDGRLPCIKVFIGYGAS